MHSASRLAMVALLGLALHGAALAAAPKLGPRWSDPGSGISLRYPAGWHVSRVPWMPVSDPVQRFVLYSGPTLPSSRLAPKRHQVIAELSEVVSPLPLELGRLPSRRRRLRIPALGRMEGLDGNRWAGISFRDHGRAFDLFVGVGAAAGGLQAQLLASLESLAIRPR